MPQKTLLWVAIPLSLISPCESDLLRVCYEPSTVPKPRNTKVNEQTNKQTKAWLFLLSSSSMGEKSRQT